MTFIKNGVDIQSIFDNWYNGNKKDCVKLVKKYGFKKFIVDALSMDDCYLSIIKYYAEFSKGVS